MTRRHDTTVNTRIMYYIAVGAHAQNKHVMTTSDKTVVKRCRFQVIFGNFNLRLSQYLTEKNSQSSSRTLCNAIERNWIYREVQDCRQSNF